MISEGADSEFVYLLGYDLNSTDVYTVGLIREGEVEEILSCGISLLLETGLTDVFGEEEIMLDRNVLDCGSTLVVDGEGECVVRWWSVTGVLIKEENIVMGEMIETPDERGIYLLELESARHQKAERVIIK